MSTTLRRMLVLTGVVVGLVGAANGSAPAAAQEERREDAAGSDQAAQRPMLGIRVWHVGAGVMVDALLPGGPADMAGVRIGDRIVSINGHPLDEPLEDEDTREFPEGVPVYQARLEWLMQETPEGEPIEVGVERGRQTLTFPVVAEALPDSEPDAMLYRDLWPDPTFDSITELFRDAMERVRFRVGPDEFEFVGVPPGFTAGRILGDPGFPLPPVDVTPSVTLIDAGDWRDRFRYVGGNRLEMIQLNPELGAYFGTEEGVLVLDVDENVTLGLRPGDVVVSIGGREVDEVSDMQRILASYEEDEAVDFGIWRDGARATVVGTIR